MLKSCPILISFGVYIVTLLAIQLWCQVTLYFWLLVLTIFFSKSANLLLYLLWSLHCEFLISFVCNSLILESWSWCIALWFHCICRAVLMMILFHSSRGNEIIYCKWGATGLSVRWLIALQMDLWGSPQNRTSGGHLSICPCRGPLSPAQMWHPTFW